MLLRRQDITFRIFSFNKLLYRMGNMRKVPFLNGFDRYYKPEKQT